MFGRPDLGSAAALPVSRCLFTMLRRALVVIFHILASSVLLNVPVRCAKRAAVASCVLSSSVSCRLPRSTVASAGLHGLGNARELITRGVFSAAIRCPLAGRVRTAPCTSSCVRRRLRFEFDGVDTSPTPGAPVPRFSARSGRSR